MKANNISNTTTGPLVSPITPSELADYMSLDYDAGDDALLTAFLLTSCEMCISYTNQELLERTWVYKADFYPVTSSGVGGLGPIPAISAPWIELPITPVASITGITIDSVAYTDFTEDLTSTPARIELSSLEGPIEITYLAGNTLATDIDARLLMGITMLAAYLFDNRGCDMSKAIDLSGAATVWWSTKMLIGGL